jgi:hypothetical protein
MLRMTGNPGMGLPGLSLPSMPSLEDMNLRIDLPELEPQGAPDWFVKGNLYVEITGRPSFMLKGSMTVKIKEDVLTFFVEGEIARDGAGVALSLTGGLQSEGGWKSPFGIDWLTIRKAILRLSVNSLGNVGIGFAGDIAVGRKNVSVAIALAMSPVGVPTNLVLYAESKEGISVADFVLLQQSIAKADGRPGPTIPLHLLPNIAVKDLRLQFAPRDEPRLGVEAGFAVSGELWIEVAKGEELTLLGELDLSVDRSGIRARGFLAGFGIGPLEWSDAELELVLTLAEQRIAMSGTAALFGRTRSVFIELTGKGLLEDFLDAHGAALGKGVAEAKAKIAAAKAAAKAKLEKAKAAVATLRGRLKPQRPVLPWRR